MLRRFEGEQQADGAGIGRRRPHRLNHAGDLVGFEGLHDTAAGGDPLSDFQPALLRHQRPRRIQLQVVHVRTHLTANFQQVAKALGRDQRYLAAAPLDQSIRRHRRTMSDTRGAAQVQRSSGCHLLQAGQNGAPRIVGRRCALVERLLTRFRVDGKEVREGAAYVNTDHPNHGGNPFETLMEFAGRA